MKMNHSYIITQSMGLVAPPPEYEYLITLKQFEEGVTKALSFIKESAS